MSLATSKTEVVIFPRHVLSSRSWRDHLVVLAWTFWSPLMFMYYGGELLRRELEAGFPIALEQRALDRWRARNPGQREIVRLGIHVCFLLFAGIALVNALCAAPLNARPLDEVLAQSALFALLFAFTWLAQLAGGYLVARQTGNVGALLLAALPSGVFAAILMLFACWLRYTPLYLDHAAWWSRLVFLFCGFGVGFSINYVLAMLQREPLRPRALLGVCLLAAMGALAILFLADGVTLQTAGALLAGQHAQVWFPWVLWSAGFALGFLRPLEAIYYLLRRQPGIGPYTQRRTWSVPGSTLLPAPRVKWALQPHLRGNWDRGVQLAAELSYVSHQQRPLAQAMAGEWDGYAAGELAEQMAAAGDSGALCVLDAMWPPNLKRPPRWGGGKRRSGGAAQGSGSAAGARGARYEQQTALAKALRHSPAAPELLPDRGRDPERRQLAAAYCCYGEGYVHQAADLLLELAAGGSEIAQSAGFLELRAFAETYVQLLDFAAMTAKPAVELPPRPAGCRRRQAWAVVDRFVEAARWLWRMQTCPLTLRETQTSPRSLRDECWQMFDQRLGRIERLARRGTLLERRLILGVAALWRKEAKKLYEVLAQPPEPVKVGLRAWDEVYRELDGRCPWRQVGAALYAGWQPGRRAAIFVRSQPKVDCVPAVVLAVAEHAVRQEGSAGGSAGGSYAGACVLLRFDLRRWVGAPDGRRPSLAQFCAEVCREVAAALRCKELLPGAAAMGALAEPEVRALLQKLCDVQPECSVVLLVEQAQLLVSTRRPWPDAARWLGTLGQWERTIDNMALTVLAEGGEATWGRLQRGLRVPVAPVWVPLLTPAAVAEALRRQFDTSGVRFGESGLDQACRLTGGHPQLLARLGRAVATLYNQAAGTLPAGPIIDRNTVDRAVAADERYAGAARAYSRALAAALGRGINTDCAWVLYRLARTNLGGSNATPDAFAGVLPAEANRLFDEWWAGEVLEVVAGATWPEYRLRSLAYAQWLVAQGPPQSAQPGMAPPGSTSSGGAPPGSTS